MAVVFKNNAKTTLASSLSSSATSVSVADGSVFPSLGSGEIFFCTLDDGTNNEIVKVTAVSSNTLTVVRAQESTTARSFASGDAAELRLTAGILSLFSQTGVAITDEIEAYLDANGLTFPDSVIAKFGASNDLKIQHNGTNSFIDNETGGLYIRQKLDDGDVFIQSDNGSGGLTNYFRADGSNGQAQLFHYGSQKLNTTSTGIDVTGVAVVDGLTSSAAITSTSNSNSLGGTTFTSAVSGTSLSLSASITASGNSNSFGNSSFGTISSGAITSTGGITSSSSGFIEHRVDQTDSGLVRMGVSSGSAEAFIIAGNTGGNHASSAPVIKFMLDTDGGSLVEEARIDAAGLDIKNGALDIAGTTVIDASRNLTNIGTISSGAITTSGFFNINAAHTVYAGLVTTTSTATTSYNVIRFTQGSGSGAPTGLIGTAGSAVGNTAFRSGMNIGTQTSGSLNFIINDGYVGKFDTSGNLLVSKTSSDLTTDGIELRDTGGIVAIRTNGDPLYLNRKSTDGAISTFAKDGTTIGVIGTKSGDLIAGTGDTGIRFDDANNAIYAHNTSTNAYVDDAISLGFSGIRFKDLHLSGTISSGAISATQVGVTNIVTNKVVKFNGSILDDSSITDTGSAITLGNPTTVTGNFESSSHILAQGYYRIHGSGILLQLEEDAWTSADTHHVLYNGWTSPTGDYVYLAAAGNGTPVGTIVVSDSGGFYYGTKSSTTGAITASATAPLTNTKLRVDTSGNATFAGSIQGTSFSDGTISGITFIDEDSFSTNSATRVPTQQSVKAYVDAQVAGVVDSAPSALNTLNELAAALGDDSNFATTTSTSLGNRLRVDTASQGLTATQQGNAITNLGITATKAELNFVDGVTSNIQTQLNARLTSSSSLNASNISSGTLSNSRLPTQLKNNHLLSGSNAILRFGETDVTNTPVWWLVADGGNFSIRLNNSGGYPLNITTNSDNNAVSSIGLGYATTIQGNTAWHAGNDGSGSGLDADSVDGVHAYSFLRSDAADTSSGNLTFNGTSTFTNNILQSGGTFISHGSEVTSLTTAWQAAGTTKNRGILPFRYQNGATGQPESGNNANWGLNIYAHGGSSGNYPYGTQFAMGSSQNLYFRWWSNGGAQGWQEVWTSANDGSGSGLDSDTVDGIQASSFLRSDASDTATGSIVFNGVTQYFRRNDTTNYTNAPLIVESYGGSSTTTGIGFHISGQLGRYLRMNSSGVLAWEGSTIWHAGNDGSGSGLDADTLDGINSGSFLRSDANDSASGLITLGNGVIITKASADQSTSQDSASIPSTSGAEIVKFQGGYTNGQYTTEFAKVDRSGNLPLYVRQSKGTANSFSNIARFGDHGQTNGSDVFAVFGGARVSGRVTADNLTLNSLSAQNSEATALMINGSNVVGTRELGSNAFNSTTIPTNNNQLTNGAGYITASTTALSNYIPKGGSWYGSNFPGSRWNGFSVNGGEIVFARDNPNNGQMSILVDGAYYAGENNGFYSIYSGNNYNNKVGFYGNSSGNVQFSVAGDLFQNNTAHGYIQLGPMNTSHAHIYTDRSNFYFNKTLLYANGNVMWHAGNDGSGSGLDADLLDGVHASSFLRSDASDSASGTLSLNGRVNIGNSVTRPSALNSDSVAQARIGGSDVYLYVASLNATGGYDVAVQAARASDFASFDLNLQSNGGNLQRAGNKVWDAGNDGSGSGLDADTVDGIQGGSFLRSDATDTFGSQLSSANNVPIRFVAANATDTNDGKIGAGVFASGLNIVGAQTSSGTGRQVRIWGDVITDAGNKFWNAGNDGSGSGLDADLLDGVQGSSYLRSDANDTFTGTLTLNGQLDLSSTDTAARYIHMPRGGGITFYGDTSQHHGIFSRNNSNSSADDILITSYGAVYIDLDSNSNNSSGADFIIGRHNSTSQNLFSINGETAHSTLGYDGQNPNFKLIYDDNHGNGDGWDTVIQLGRLQDRHSGSGVFPTYQNVNGYGLYMQGNSDGCFFGMEEYNSSPNFRPVIAWGDDTTDSPFFIRYNNSAEFAFTYDGKFHADDDIIAFSTTTSDARYKDNVSTIENALDKVQKIRGVEFDWNATSKKGKHDIGFIAQEIEEVVPEIVSEQEMLVGDFENTEEKAKTVAYGQVTALLVEAVKEQQDQIEYLKSELIKLKENNNGSND